MTNQHIEQLNKVLSTATKIEFVIRNEFSVTRNGLMNLVSKCENLKRIRIDQPNIAALPPIEISMQGIKENIWNKDWLLKMKFAWEWIALFSPVSKFI